MHVEFSFLVDTIEESFVESVSKVFSDGISRLFIPYMSYGSETLHRGLSQFVSTGKNIFFTGNRPLQIVLMPPSAKLCDTHSGAQTAGLQ